MHLPGHLPEPPRGHLHTCAPSEDQQPRAGGLRSRQSFGYSLSSLPSLSERLTSSTACTRSFRAVCSLAGPSDTGPLRRRGDGQARSASEGILTQRQGRDCQTVGGKWRTRGRISPGHRPPVASGELGYHGPPGHRLVPDPADHPFHLRRRIRGWSLGYQRRRP